MAKVKYLISGKEVKRDVFYKRLKSHCFRRVRTDYVNGFGIDFEEFDSAKFSRYCRDLNGDVFEIIFLNESFRIVK